MSRINKIRAALKTAKIDAFVVTYLPGIRYLTGFSGSNATLIIQPNKLTFITDGRYEEQIKTELFDLANLKKIVERDVWKVVKDNNLFKSAQTIGFQSVHATYASVETMKKELKELKLKFKPVGNIVENVTMIKTPDEVANIKKAADLAAKVYDYILGFVKPGMRETEIAAEISYVGRKFGSEGDAFDIIVASGERGALPHGRASDKKVKKGELITLDFGCIYNGFNSDMTRTFALGKPGKFQKEIFDLVLRAEIAGIEAVKAGINIRALDAVSRKIIEDAGYGKEFNHSLGHGLGIDVHESPGLSFRAPEKDVLLENSVITIEPGIYVAGKCGVRVEDDVLVTKNGCEILTTAPKELIVV